MNDAPQQPNDDDSKSHTFRKRRLSLARHNLVEETSQHPKKRARRDSAVSQSSAHSHREFPCKVQHAPELLTMPPPSPAVHDVLYQQPFVPAQVVVLPSSSATSATSITGSRLVVPKWKTQHLPKDLHRPFHKDIVGMYSCHGVEPIYDSDYEHEEEDDGWCPSNTTEETTAETTLAAKHKPDEGEGLDGDSTIATAAAAAVEITTTTTSQQPIRIPAAKINQDRAGVAFPYGNCPKTALFAVYDGHGQGGELVAQFCLYEIQRRLEKHPAFPKKQSFVETFCAVDQALAEEELIEPLYAGTTACVALLQEKTLTLANCGDSRAVLARLTPNGYQTILLTEDQNPDLPEEQMRIVGAGGFVTASPGPGLSARVWLDAECTLIGLAMARSLGDHAVSEVGVIADPVVTHYDLDQHDAFMILATDGVWEFVESEEAVQLVAENLHRGATKACQALIEAAAARWHEEEGEYRDDITAIVVRLQALWDNDKSESKTQA